LFLDISIPVNYASLTTWCLWRIIVRLTEQFIYTPSTFFGLLAEFPIAKAPYDMAKVNASFKDDSFQKLSIAIQMFFLTS
jgi:hypothetical protein